MTGKKKWISCMIILVFLMICISCAHAKPPKPGPGFVWVKVHTTPAGHLIPGHWKYTGTPVSGKTWVQGHHNGTGDWVEGDWQILTPSKKGANWVPGHYGPRGKWISGHWR